MAASPPSRRLILPLVIVVLGVLALWPSRWYGFSGPLHGAAATLLSPLTWVLMSFNSSVRQQVERPIVVSDLQELNEELRQRDGVITGLIQRVGELEALVSQLQGFHSRHGDDYFFVYPDVISRSSDPAAGTLQISEGAGARLQVGLPVVDGANLVGRLIQVAPTTATIQPITARGQLIEAVLVPPLLPEGGLPADRTRTVQLRADGSPLLRADDVDRAIPVAVGDYARLYDSHGGLAWPTSVQGYLIGVVTAVEPNPDDALRKRVTVRPLTSLHHLAKVTVIVPRAPVSAAGSGTLPGAGAGAASR